MSAGWSDYNNVIFSSWSTKFPWGTSAKNVYFTPRNVIFFRGVPLKTRLGWFWEAIRQALPKPGNPGDLLNIHNMFDFAATVLSNMKIKYGSGFSEPLIWQLKETCYAPFYKM